MSAGLLIITGLLLALGGVVGGCEPSDSVGDGAIVLCLGDSLTACGGSGGRYSDWLAAALPGALVINAGENGETLAGGRARFQREVLATRPDVLVLALGANDFWRQRPIEQIAADLEWMVSQARAARIEVVLASCFGGRNLEAEAETEFGPERFELARAIAAAEADIARRYDCFYVPDMQAPIKPNGRDDYWSDDMHPNAAGNRLVADEILPQLRHALARANG